MDNKIRDNLEEQFDKLRVEDSPPEQLKTEIFQTLDTMNMIGDIADLFTSQFVQTNVKLISPIKYEEADESIVEKDSDNNDEKSDDNDSYTIEEPDNQGQE